MFSDRLKNLLDFHDMTQLELSRKLSVSPQMVNRWCQGIYEPDNKMLVKIANVLEVSTDYLLGNDSNISINIEIKKRDLLLNILKECGYLDENESADKEEIKVIFNFLKANKRFIKSFKVR